MAKSGTKAAVGRPGAAGAQETRDALVRGAIDALKEQGFAGASAREIARRAGCNQGLVFYHFGSVTNLLLAALDEVSATRHLHYQAAVDRAHGLDALVDAAEQVFEEDLDAGHIAVLAEMIAGASATPGLAPEVAARIAPWRAFAADALGGVARRHSALGGRRARRRGPCDRCALLRAGDVGASRRGPHGRLGAVRTRPAARRARPGNERPSCRRASTKGEVMNEATVLGVQGQEMGAQGFPEQGFDVVTGAFSYSGAAIARALERSGRRVRTLTGHPGRADPDSAIDVRPLDFDDVVGLTASLEGATTLYNTYWVRFPHGHDDHERAVANSRTLFHAARQAGIERIVHVSITHPSISSPYGYFRGKAQVERALAEVGVPYAVLRPSHPLRRRRRPDQQHRLAAAAPARLRRGRQGRLPDPAGAHRRPGRARGRRRARSAPTRWSTRWARIDPRSSSWSG